MRLLLLLLAVVATLRPAPVLAQETGTPEYATAETRLLIERMVDAHGGLDPWQAVEVIGFNFFTKNSGNPNPWFSRETTDRRSGRAILDWPYLDASIVWDGSEVWSVNWPVQIPPGFFTRLTYSFITMPWLTQSSGARLEATGTGKLPNDDTQYATVRMTLPHRSASIPGTYYELFIDPSSHLLKAIGFDLAHPGMVANPDQPLGPNYHVFEEYSEYAGLTIPTYYVSYGFNQRNKKKSSAIHVVFDLTLNESFDEARMEKPIDAVVDEATLNWWRERTASTSE